MFEIPNFYKFTQTVDDNVLDIIYTKASNTPSNIQNASLISGKKFSDYKILLFVSGRRDERVSTFLPYDSWNSGTVKFSIGLHHSADNDAGGSPSGRQYPWFYTNLFVVYITDTTFYCISQYNDSNFVIFLYNIYGFGKR